jgi:YD repeat-containing protein
VVSVTDPLTHTTVYTYNTVGLWVGQLDANGVETTFTYDGLRRRIGIDYPAGTTDVSFAYNAAGNRTVMTDTVGTTLWAYDALGRPLTVTAPLTGTVSYRYDRLGNRTHLIYPDGKVVTDTYTALGQLADLTDWAGQATGFQYDAAGRPLTTTLPGGMTNTQRYDTAHRLLGLSHTTLTGTLASYTYTLDAVGNRMAVTETVRQPGAAPAADLLFADGFESGDLSAWSASVTDGGDLSATAGAALHGSYGLNVKIDDNTSLYVQDDTPDNETRYRARFRFDPNSIAMGGTDQHQLFWGYTGASTDVVPVVFRCTGGACPSTGSYEVRVELRDTASNWTTSSWFTLTDAPHDLEIDWQASASGSLTFWLDGTQQASLTGVDNSNRDIDFVRLGPLTGIDTGTRGSYFLDEFESRTSSYIGPSGTGTGSLLTQAITHTYDALYRATDVLYADGTHFQYAYDAAGNVLTRTQTVLSVMVVTTYTYRCVCRVKSQGAI